MEWKRFVNKKTVTALVSLLAAIAGSAGYHASPEVRDAIIEIVNALAQVDAQ